MYTVCMYDNNVSIVPFKAESSRAVKRIYNLDFDGTKNFEYWVSVLSIW